MSKIDLHCHTNASDGALSPEAVVQRAIDYKLTHLAITDHDTVRGIAAAQQAAAGRISIVPGIEISTTWQHQQIHIVGLFIDPNCQDMLDLVAEQNGKRIERAEKIGYKLSRIGFPDAYERTKAMAGEGAIITRGNYARFLVSVGGASSTDDAFNAFLKKGKRAYVSTEWMDIATAVAAIKKSGGVAVLAHPRRYDLTNMKLRRLIEEFKECGGVALEVSSCQQGLNDRDYLARLCRQYEMLGSVGSDFHSEGPYRDIGRNIDLPAGIIPVWTRPEAAPYAFLQTP